MLQLVFPNDGLFAVAVEGISPTETAKLGSGAEEVADLVLYYGGGENFQTCDRLETVQFKYKERQETVTASYLKKTLEKFCDTIVGYEKAFSKAEADKKVSFAFVTNAQFSDSLWEAIKSFADGIEPSSSGGKTQARNLKLWCAKRGVADASALLSRTAFRAGEKDLAAQDNALQRTLTDWSAGADAEARVRLHGLQDLVLKKAGPSGLRNNLITREDVLDALNCDPDDLFPAETQFIDVGTVVERAELSIVGNLLEKATPPVFVHAEGGVGKTVFVQSLAARMASRFEVVVFDCFGGGSYRSEDQSRHLPRIGLVQIVNELASRTLCDPLLPSGEDTRKVIRAARRRLAQAAAAIRTQSQKHGLLIIVDAADNSQLEANDRHEEAFPTLLLSSISEEPLEGVRLLLTARTHRRATVIGRATVEDVELGPFTEGEAREFLLARRPGTSTIEITTALARSRRNARVLDYLLETWDTNVLGKASAEPIEVPEIIAGRCNKIVAGLRKAGWPESEVTEFFAALSLLPPPIPLEELATALSWPPDQVSTAASDLAPMLEVSSHGAIFRDEPTETYVRDTYKDRPDAEKAIADRLLAAQATSTYAAEALPHFLVVIKDSDRAFALAESTTFPTTVQSDFGKRRLTLARLRAAFRLSVGENDFDRTLGLSMRLAQAATANMRGDEFIRRSPPLAVVLGDSDSYRRLYADRSGWRGARSARLTVAHQFAGDADEAQIQAESTIRWINWHSHQPNEETTSRQRPAPGVDDYAAVMFQSAVEGQFAIVDRNLARWNDRFSLSACDEVLRLLELNDQIFGTSVLKDFVSFAAGDEVLSNALKVRLLTRPHLLSKGQARRLAKSIESPVEAEEDDDDYSSAVGTGSDLSYAALTALLFGSRASSLAIIRKASVNRPSAYDFGERYGNSKIWLPVFQACVQAWAAGRAAAYHDFLPRDVKVNRAAKSIATRSELLGFLDGLREPSPSQQDVKGKTKLRKQFRDREREDIANGIELTMALVAPIENAALTRRDISSEDVGSFLEAWSAFSKPHLDWRREGAVEVLSRTIGLGCVNVLLSYAAEISLEQAEKLVESISAGRFYVSQKVEILRQLARRPSLHELAARFAQHVAEQIRKDDNIGNRGSSYADLAEALVAVSVDEAREYYRQGLAQLDQMGGESYDQIYSLLRFAAVQEGGLLKPELGQRLMNLCQAIAADEPSKFGWTLFGRAAAKSIGLPALGKLVRWHDQDVSELSYALPQLVCFLAQNGRLDPRRAAFLLVTSKEHGWWDWHAEDGIGSLLELCSPAHQRLIFSAMVSKLRAEHVSGAWPSLWESLLKVAAKYPNAVTNEERQVLQALEAEATIKKDEFNSRNKHSPNFDGPRERKLTEPEVIKFIENLLAEFDFADPSTIDRALKAIQAADGLPYDIRQRFLKQLRATCPYAQRLAFLFAVCEASELELRSSLDIMSECVSEWSPTTKHLASNLTALVDRLLQFKSAGLFERQYSSLERDVHLLAEFCQDKRHVLRLVLGMIVRDEIELDGDEWLQLAVTLCDQTSGQAGLSALELLLSGSTSRIADEIGEGPLRPEQAFDGGEADIVADITWHLLGDDDAYLRWAVARGFSTLAVLGFESDLHLLVDRFDRREMGWLTSADRKLPFQNSQQWMLMGLARAALSNGKSMTNLVPKLRALAKRTDVHVTNKVHVARCLNNIVGAAEDAELSALIEEVDYPAAGTLVSDLGSQNVPRKTDFGFDYEFTKIEISTLARLFNVAQSVIEEAMATEIIRHWPDATSMDYFPGQARYGWDRHDQHEFYREHVQRHALLSAATTLSKTLPVVVRSYETDRGSAWLEWRQRYDTTFDDGSWLSDRKDPVPTNANESLLGKRVGDQETLQDQTVVLRKLGIVAVEGSLPFPLHAHWTSPDGVEVSIVSALTETRGAIGRCAAFAKEPSHNLWLPQFWEGGYYDRTYRNETPFLPLVWGPEGDFGVDEGDELAARGPGARPRLGIDLTRELDLATTPGDREWVTSTGALALRSQVWGGWQRNPDDTRYRSHHDGEVLWASPDWLELTLAKMQKQLVFTVTLWKYRSSKDYDRSSGAKSVIIGLRGGSGMLRFWHAKLASRQDY
nr:NACHT domain-containing protein [uncultured Devosia sp.]